MLNAKYSAAILLMLGMAVTVNAQPDPGERKGFPNIVIILADDLGYGDLSCYNNDPVFRTPHIDSLARAGTRFTDAHSSSAVCTPTRYSLLTGRYAWRSRLKRGVLTPWDPPLIEPGRLTLPAMLKEKGYYTAAVGKWHLGWNWPTYDSAPAKEKNGENVNYDLPVKGGPLDYGFDYYFGDDVPNYPPYTFIGNDKVLAKPLVRKPRSMFGNKGMMAEGWSLEDVMPAITKKAVEIVEKASDDQNQPFFLYFALTAPHTPIAPSENFRGKSGAGPYGDYVMEVDWSVGQIMSALKRKGLTENTLVIFTSDNGSPGRDGKDHAGPVGSISGTYQHRPNGNLRGLKADIWEGGHRVPFIVSWNGKVGKGREDDRLICSMDLMATVAGIVRYRLPEQQAEDSRNILPLFLGERVPGWKDRPLVHHSLAGVFAIRRGRWKLILSDISGGFSDNIHPDGYGITTPGQLYDLKADPGETENLYEKHPGRVEELRKLLEDIRAQ